MHQRFYRDFTPIFQLRKGYKGESRGMYVGMKGIYYHHDTADPVLKDPGKTQDFGDVSDRVIGGGLAVGYDFDKRFALCLRVGLEFAIRDMALLTLRRGAWTMLPLWSVLPDWSAAP
jgi:hypothetical protein